MQNFNALYVKEKMNELGMSTRRLAIICNVSPATISRLLNGEISDPKISLLASVAIALDVPIDNIVNKNTASSIMVKGVGKEQNHTFSSIIKAIKYAQSKKFTSIIIPADLELSEEQEEVLSKIQNGLLNYKEEKDT